MMMDFFSDRYRRTKIVLLVLFLASGPLFGLMLGPRTGVYLSNLDWSAPTIPVGFLEVVSASSEGLTLYDGYDRINVMPSAELRATGLSVGDLVSGVLERQPHGYRLARPHRHVNRFGKHAVSLIPLIAIILWIASSIRVGSDGLAFKRPLVTTGQDREPPPHA